MNMCEELDTLLALAGAHVTFDIDRCNHCSGRCQHVRPESGQGHPTRDDARAGWRND